MNFQEKLFEATADLRSRAATLATSAIKSARASADQATKRVQGLSGSFQALSVVGRELNKVARRHATRFVKQNSSIATEAGKDVSALARSTFATLAKRPTARKARKARKPAATRKRATTRTRKAA